MSGLGMLSNGEFELEITPHPVDKFRIRGTEVAAFLGYRNAADLARAIPTGEKGYASVRTPGGDQRVLYLTLPGFLRAMGQRHASRVPDEENRARVVRFQNWVFGDVIPDIFEKGSYTAPGAIPQQRQPESVALPNARELALMVIEAEDAKALLAAQVAELEPAAEAWRGLAEADGAYQVGDAAKILCNAGHQMGRQRLFDYLGDLGWVFRGKSIDGTSKGPWHANQRRVDDKLLVEVPMKRPARDEAGTVIGGQVAPAQIRITVKGIEKLHGLLSRELLALPAS